MLRVCLFTVITSLGVAGTLLGDQPETEGTLAVMTWNIRYDNRGDGANAWRHRRNWVAEIIRREQPDVL